MGTRRTDENDSGTVEDQSWVMLVLAFEDLLVSYGNGLYEQIWQGAGTRTDDELGPSLRQLTQQLRRLGKLMGSVQQSWQQAAAKVGQWRRTPDHRGRLDSRAGARPGRGRHAPIPGHRRRLRIHARQLRGAPQVG